MRCMSDKVLCGFFACCLIGVVLCSVTSAETIQIGRLPLKPACRPIRDDRGNGSGGGKWLPAS